MLGDKSLENLTFDADEEVHDLWLLKLRFGNKSLRHCEVTIKDVDDSKNTNISMNFSVQSNNSH